MNQRVPLISRPFFIASGDEERRPISSRYEVEALPRLHLTGPLVLLQSSFRKRVPGRLHSSWVHEKGHSVYLNVSPADTLSLADMKHRSLSRYAKLRNVYKRRSEM